MSVDTTEGDDGWRPGAPGFPERREMMSELPATEEQLADYVYSAQNYTDAKEIAAHLWPIINPAASVWRPIETAPKDIVILYFPQTKGKNSQGEMRAVGRVSAYPFRLPTHWMPLPASPEQETGR